MVDVEIPKRYKACVYDAPGKVSTKVEMLEMPEPGPGEVLIHLPPITSTSRQGSLNLALIDAHLSTHSGVCHSDLGIMENTWESLPAPTQAGQVGGHEGVGKVVKLGPGTESSSINVGDRVGIKWVSGTCGNCPPCLEGSDALCHKAKVSGYFTPGTFQQYCLGPANYVTPIPDELESADAAPMLCAGITTYAALRRSGARSGQWIVVAGAGGGLGHIACQLASRGMALRVIGIDDGSKEQLVKKCGAEHFIDINKHDDASMSKEVVKVGGGLGASAVIVCTASNRAYAQALDFLRFGGTVVCVGIPEGTPQAIANSYPAALVFKQATITAVAVGNRRDAIECMEFAARGMVKTHFRLEKMEKLKDVFQEMKEGKLMGRVVIDLQ